VSCTAARHLCIAWVSECSSLVVQGDGEQDWQWFCSLFVPASRQRAIYSKIPHDRRVLNFRLLFLLHCACHVDLSLVRVEGVLELDALGVQEEALSARASIFSISDNRSAQSRCAVNPQLVLAARDRLQLEPNPSVRAVRPQYTFHDRARGFPVNWERYISRQVTQDCLCRVVRLYQRLVGLVNALVLQQRRELGSRKARAGEHEDTRGAFIQSMHQSKWLNGLVAGLTGGQGCRQRREVPRQRVIQGRPVLGTVRALAAPLITAE
jgi:hypothetical protein